MEADSFPQSAREAKEHIRQIRFDKGLGDGPEQIGNNGSDLASALKILSNDLYQTATHFLLELIQNADDNSYSVEVPTLSIAYSSGRVRIDCNERGFSKQNIEAICRICKSTKSGRSKSAGFVGEKGFGFKAVFKVASKVWISSGHYSFRFERDAHLGMIAPIWDTFPEEPRKGSTSILLNLAKECDEESIIDELKSYDEKILLFLRRLRRLEIHVKPSTLSFRNPGTLLFGKLSALLSRKPFQTILSRHDESSEKPSMMTLVNDGLEKHYFVWHHSANHLPVDSHRPGISSSEVVLAFPHTGTNGDFAPIIEKQNVYAFLPVRDVGFQFLLQADFLLTANREDVHDDSPWNKALATAAAIAYVNAVRHMGNLNNPLRYSWVRYIPIATSNTGFFEGLRQDILKRLRKSRILESHSGRKKKPASLVTVPAAWRDPSGQPFMIRRRNREKFLARQYDASLGLLDLGVKLIDQNAFLKEMAKALGSNPASFLQNKTNEWHAGLARALLAMLPLPSLPIIPLRNGKWVGDGDIYLPNSKCTSAIPEGIEMNIVNPEAAADSDRREFFVRQGAQDLLDSHIRGAIWSTHEGSKFKPHSLGPDTLVSHAEFLFRTYREDYQGTVYIWMATDLGSYRKSSMMYLPSDLPGAASNILPRGAFQKYGFLHPAYLKAGGSNKKPWCDYLQKHHGVSVYTRLFNDYSLVHDDFKLIVQGSPSQRWLTFLRDNWEFYETHLHRSNQPLAYIREREVRCTGSVQSERVGNTYMPLDHLTREYGALLPFLDIPDPQNPRWEPLMKYLGVSVNLRFFNDSGLVHDDFKRIIQSFPSQRWLTLLRDNWEFYGPRLDGTTYRSNQLLAYLRQREVRCTKSVQFERVSNTYMPLDHLTREFGALLPFLDISDPQNPRWEPLMKCLKVSVNLRLFNDIDLVHDDFKRIIQGFPSQRWLTLLRDNWEFYGPCLDGTTRRSNQLLAYFREREVRCTGSVQLEQVSNTYMPLDRLTREYGALVPFLNIPDPQNPRWKPLLKSLLVRMEDDITFYLKCLSGAKKNDTISSGKIRDIMHEIENRVDKLGDASLVRDTISNERLIYIPPGKDEGKRGSWVSLSDCFWRGESWLTQSVGLEKLYPGLETLFHTHLLVPNAGIDHLIREAAAISPFSQPAAPAIEKLFLALTAHVKIHGLSLAEKTRIQELSIFPIVLTPETKTYKYLTSVTSKKPWLIADRASFRTQFQHVMPVLAFSAEFILQVKRFLEALDLKDRFLSRLATSITEAHGDVELHKELTQRYQTRSKYLFRLMPESQTDEKHLREKFRKVNVYMASKIVQYWLAPLGLRQVRSALAEGTAFLECDYAGDLRIYLQAGYENEVYPYELVEQLRNFFNVPIEHSDLLPVALIAPEDRVDQLFEKRGIAPLLEEGFVGEEHEEDATYAPVYYRPEPSKKSRSRFGGDSRFSRLFSHTRFSPSFFRQTNSSLRDPPSYNVAVARATQNAIGRPAEPRTFASALTLPSLERSLTELEFVQERGAVVGSPKSPPTILDRVRGLAQRDADIGEAIVSDILAAVLGAQYDRARMWTARDQRKNDQATFNFADMQGRFSAFLMRLDGLPGKAQGYTRMIYHLDVKVTDSQSFKITQDELDRARENSVHSQPDPEEQAPLKHVSVLVYISDFRTEPQIRFLADPWDLFEDGQLILENTRNYQARLNLRLRQPAKGAGDGDVGFDSVQIRQHEDLDNDVPRQEDEKEKSTEKKDRQGTGARHGSKAEQDIEARQSKA